MEKTSWDLRIEKVKKLPKVKIPEAIDIIDHKFLCDLIEFANLNGCFDSDLESMMTEVLISECDLETSTERFEKLQEKLGIIEYMEENGMID